MEEQVREIATEVWQTSHWTNEQIKRLEHFAALVRNAALEQAAQINDEHGDIQSSISEAIRNLKEPTP